MAPPCLHVTIFSNMELKRYNNRQHIKSLSGKTSRLVSTGTGLLYIEVYILATLSRIHILQIHRDVNTQRKKNRQKRLLVSKFSYKTDKHLNEMAIDMMRHCHAGPWGPQDGVGAFPQSAE